MGFIPLTPVLVAGIGLVTAAGLGADSAWKALSTRQDLRGLIPSGNEYRYVYLADVPDGAENRLVRMACMAIDSIVSESRPDVLCLGSTTASFRERSAQEFGHSYNSDYLTPGALSEKLAQMYRIPKAFQFSQACASSGYAIAIGCDLIAQGKADVVLAGGVDEVLESVVDAFAACRIYANECRPFDIRRNGLILGEAAAFVLLSRKGVLAPLDRDRPCFITGTGLTCDAHDMAAPDSNGIADAIEWSAERSIPGFVVAHATGTKVGDEIEAQAIFKAGYSGIPTASFKGGLGHSQGASGAVGVVLGVEAYQRRERFPSTGFDIADPGILGTHVSSGITPLHPGRVLCISSGTWGVNAAIMLGDTRQILARRPPRQVTGVVDFQPTPTWPTEWAHRKMSGKRVRPSDFGMTVSNNVAGKLAIDRGLNGPQITLSYGNPHELAELMIETGKAREMIVA